MKGLNTFLRNEESVTRVETKMPLSIGWVISILSPSKTSFKVSAHRQTNITLLTLVAVVARGVADVYP